MLLTVLTTQATQHILSISKSKGQKFSKTDTHLLSNRTVCYPCKSAVPPLDNGDNRTAMENLGNVTDTLKSTRDSEASEWGHSCGKRQKQQLISKDITLLAMRSVGCGRGLGIRLCGRWWLLIIRRTIDEVSQHGSCIILLLLRTKT